MRKAKLSTKLMVVACVVLALVLIFAITSTALASDNHYKFDASKWNGADLAKLSAMFHISDWSKVAWCNIDLKHMDWAKILAWLKDHKFHWGCKPKPKPPCSSSSTTAVTSPATTTPETAAEVETGGGGTAGPGAGIWALGILALALAGGLGWTAVRPAVKRK